MAYPLEHTIKVEQIYNKNSLGFLWAKRDSLDPGQRALLDSLYKGRTKKSLLGVFSTEYTLSSTGAGKLGFGRVYGAKGSMEKLERECRGTLCSEFYYDIDVCNAHPVIAFQFAKYRYNMDLTEVEKYCDNRDEYLKLISDNKDEAKTAIISVLYGGKNEFHFLNAFCEDIKKLTKSAMTDDDYKDLLAYVRKCDKNIYGTFLSYILQTEERRVMMSMRDTLMNEGWSVDVLAYDGVMIRKDPNKKFDDPLLKKVEDIVFQQTNYKIKLINKPMESYDVPKEDVEISPKVTQTQYNERKMLFEEHHFYFEPTNTIAEIRGSELCFYEKEHAKIAKCVFNFKHGNFLNDQTCFIDLWLKDSTKRTINRLDQKPSDDPHVYSTPLLFKYNQSVESDEKAIEQFIDLVNVLSNHSKPIATYLTSWIAHLIQKPFENPGTAIILTGGKGCGKDTLGDFISECLLGRSYSHNYTSTRQFWDKHDTDRLNKLFIKLEEAEGYTNKKHIGELKARITSHSNTVNPKCMKSITSSNYNRYFMTTNEGQPVKSEVGERRFNTFACSNEWIGDHSRWESIRSVMFSPAGAKAVGDWLMTLDISNFSTKVLPENEYQEMAIQSDRGSEDLFIESLDTGRQFGGVELYRLYHEYCESKKLEKIETNTMFGRALLVLIRDGKLSKKHTRTGAMYEKK